MTICKLCKKKTKLCVSHIFPDHLYREARDDKNRFIGIKVTGAIKLRQIGLWERLFCTDCEQLLSHNYENYFAEFWFNKKALPDYVYGDTSIYGIDYLKFKLYHLSILFRASVSTQPSFAGINLGAKEEMIRKLLIEQRDDTQCKISGKVLIRNNNSVEKRFITPHYELKYGKYSSYYSVYGGCRWKNRYKIIQF